MDFLMISKEMVKGVIEIYPKFIIKHVSDLMIRGGDFYAIWLPDKGLWSTDENDVINLIDEELDKYEREHANELGPHRVLHMWDSDTGMIDNWHKYCQKQMRDSFHALDEKLIFSNMQTCKEDYASKKLNYPLIKGDHSSYDKLISTLYSDEERHKIEWSIGSIVTGASKSLQKFVVLYGAAGTGKSTVINIIQKLFDGYCSEFSAKALGSSNNSFALEAFKNNPLVGLEHDGDLSRIEDNTRINSLVSHEKMIVNEKFKSAYSNAFKAFLFMGTNKPVRITDAKSGLIRRLIDVTPTGNTLSVEEYNYLYKQIDFELGAIAYHCMEVYNDNPCYYNKYVPTSMLGASNDFYNFIDDNFFEFDKSKNISLKRAWEMYKNYCEDAKVPYPYTLRAFKEELKNYFDDFLDRTTLDDGSRVRNYYVGFNLNNFESKKVPATKSSKPLNSIIDFKNQPSIFDTEYSDCIAQYANDEERPIKSWDKVTTKLKDIDTSKLHYVLVPNDQNHIFIDFDIRDSSGNKSLELNMEAASKWPATYAELSKGGQGIHLHYIYDGNVDDLAPIYDDYIEIKRFTGKSSLRRRLTKCNNLPIAHISSGLPFKGADKKMINFDNIYNEKALRTLIKNNLMKKNAPGTKPSIDFIYNDLERAYNSGMKYDVSDLRDSVICFATNSSHQADYCLLKVQDMHFKSDDILDGEESDLPLVHFDVEVFKNLFVVCWKYDRKGTVIKLINPTPEDIESLVKFNLIGFNCRKYDNHILYARMLGYTNYQLYLLSQNLVSKVDMKDKQFFSGAYNLSYTDIYDFMSDKKSLKKLEIEMGIHHQELGLPWDEEVPEELWDKVADYCANDVIATEEAFHYLSGDWAARQILADITGGSYNDTTNTLSGKLIFDNKKPNKSVFNWRDLSKPVGSDLYEEYVERFGTEYKFRVFDNNGLPQYRDYIPGEKLPNGWSILPFFPGYEYKWENKLSKDGKVIGGSYVSMYMGENCGNGGKVYSVPGMYNNVWDGDIASQHPHSALMEVIFGPEYTKRFEDLVNIRIAIKHQDWKACHGMLGGLLDPYVQRCISGELSYKDLAQALKIVINSVYGLTSAHFDNLFRDPNNVDNIVAKRGALFMTLLKSEVEKRGFDVCHIKTDSIKIPDATEAIKNFVIKFGKEYGYNFETEAIFEKFCIVNNAVYIAKEDNGKWTAVGKQFAEPYVYKTLFSHEDLTLSDLSQTIACKEGDLFLDYNSKLPDPSIYDKEIKQIKNKLKGLEKKNAHGELPMSASDYENLINESNDEIKRLEDEQFKNCHDFKFIGRVGSFCPMLPGHGAAPLARVQNNKSYAPSGTTGYIWMESEVVKNAGYEKYINMDYFDRLADEAKLAISQFGDFDWFVSDEKPQYPPYDDQGRPIYLDTGCVVTNSGVIHTDPLPKFNECLEMEIA